MNELKQKYSAEIDKILAKYPDGQKRSAIMPLLYLAQSAQGHLGKQSLLDIAEICDVTPTEVASIVGFYTLYHDEPGGRYRIQVCTDLPCALRGAEQFIEKLCQNLAIKVGETTPDGLVTVEEVTCLAGCDKAPMFQLQGDGEITYHENQSVESTLQLVEKLRIKVAESAQSPEEVGK